jgi:hypothetical protein
MLRKNLRIMVPLRARPYSSEPGSVSPLRIWKKLEIPAGFAASED